MKDYSTQWGPPSSKNWLADKCYNIGLGQIMLKSDHIMPWISQKFTYYKLLNSFRLTSSQKMCSNRPFEGFSVLKKKKKKCWLKQKM